MRWGLLVAAGSFRSSGARRPTPGAGEWCSTGAPTPVVAGSAAPTDSWRGWAWMSSVSESPVTVMVVPFWHESPTAPSSGATGGDDDFRGR